ncbi:hypothetical protein APSETT444_002099 [Aspergillus pseudonomiae]
MLFPSVRNVGLLVLGTLIAVNPTLGIPYDVSEPLDPLGPLRVTLDYGLATTWPKPQDVHISTVQRYWQYSSHIVFSSRAGDSDESNPPISDGQLWQIARDTVDEMINDRLQYGTHEFAQPRAMSILAWGNEIIVASSMKGAGSFSYDFLGGDTPIVWGDIPGHDPTTIHKNRGNCAEPMAAHLYYKNNAINLQDQKARVGTWVKGSKGWEKTDLCETNGVGLKVLDRETPEEPYTLANLAGGPTIQNQIQLCGGQPRVFAG